MLTIFSKYVKILQLSLKSEDLTNKTLNAANAFVSSLRSAVSMLVNDAVFQAHPVEGYCQARVPYKRTVYCTL